MTRLQSCICIFTALRLLASVFAFHFKSTNPTSFLKNRIGGSFSSSSTSPSIGVQRKIRVLYSSSSSFETSSVYTEDAISTVQDATNILQNYDQAQQAYIQKQPSRINSGIHTLDFCQNHVSLLEKRKLRQAVEILVCHANQLRSNNKKEEGGGSGRVMLGICAQHVTEGILGLKSFVTSLHLPRGLLHGMDVDGVPIPPEDLGSVYIKYNTGGCRTFSELRDSGIGLEGLWKPGDAFLERYEGEYRGVYLNVELEDGIFRQYGVLPTDLFFEVEEEEVW